MSMDIGRLIQCVRGHVFLYDLSHKDYKNIALKNTVWESIGRELNQNSDTVKAKWKTLRDGYTKYKKQQMRDTTGVRKKHHQYLWSAQLNFLDDYNLPKPSIDTQQDGDISQDFILPQINVPSPPLSSPQYDDRKRTHDGDVDDVINYLSAKKKRNYDGVDHLFLSYADTFKKFCPREQALLKLEMAKLFASAELRSLKNGTVDSDIHEYDIVETDRISLVVKKEEL